MSIIAAVAGGAIGFAGNIASTWLQISNNNKWNKKMLELAEIQRQDQLRQFDQQMAFADKQQRHSEAMGINDRIFRNEQAQRNADQQRYVNSVSDQNQNMALRQNAFRNSLT
jgi:hypothetical protein